MKRLLEVANQEDDSDNSSPEYTLEPNLKKQVLNNSNESSYLKLGHDYFFGEDGVEKDYEKAFEFYLKGASEEGCVESMHNVGCCYDEGSGVEQDYSKAMEWYLKASEGGNERAQFNIAILYEEGKGVEQDDVKAFEWYLKSAESNDSEAQFNVGECYENGKGIEQDLSKAFEWFVKAAEDDHSDAQFSIGLFYENGYGVEKDDVKSFEWYLKSAENGHTLSQFNVGNCFVKGKGVEQDDVKAFQWYLKSAENGHVLSQFNVGVCFEKGDGVEKDYSKAFAWYLKSTENNDSDAQFKIGKLFKYGKGIEKDLSKSFEWFMKAAENGCKLAQREVGVIFKKGEVIEKDLNKSFYWFTNSKNEHADFKLIDLNEFGIEEFKNESDDTIDVIESNNELISKVIIRFKEKDFLIGLNYLSNSKYLTTMMNQNWRNFNQTENDQIILDLTPIENEIFQQETNHIQIFEIYINYLLNNELSTDLSVGLKLNLIELSRYLGDDQFNLQIMKQSTVLERYYILFKLEMIQPIHNMIASCYLIELPNLDLSKISENESNELLNQSELSSLAKQDICRLFVTKFHKYPNSITFSK